MISAIASIIMTGIIISAVMIIIFIAITIDDLGPIWDEPVKDGGGLRCPPSP